MSPAASPQGGGQSGDVRRIGGHFDGACGGGGRHHTKKRGNKRRAGRFRSRPQAQRGNNGDEDYDEDSGAGEAVQKLRRHGRARESDEHHPRS